MPHVTDMDVSKLPNFHPLPWDTEFEPMALPDMFARTVERRGDASLLHFLGRSYSYNELFIEAHAFARALQARGIAPGDRVGLFLPNVPSYVSAYYGAMMAGAVVVNFSPLYSVDELAQQVADSGTRLLVTVDVPELYATAEKVLRGSVLETLVVSKLSAMLPKLKGSRCGFWSRQGASVRWRRRPRMDDADRRCAQAGGLAPCRTESIALLQYTGNLRVPKARCSRTPISA